MYRSRGFTRRAPSRAARFFVYAWVYPLVGLASLFGAREAHAGGFEDTVTGTIGLGRAASYGRVQDFMATWQNPANLSVVPGADIGLELRLTPFDACFDRVRVDGVEYRDADEYPDGKFEGSETFQNVCNAGPIGLAGNLGWAQSFDSGWGFGAGLFTPASVGSLKFGDDTVVTWPPYFDNEQYEVTLRGEEWPTRQMLIEQESVAAWLAAGAGLRIIPELRVGLGVAVGFARLRSSAIASLAGGTFRDQEYWSEIDATDWFVPRAIASVVGSPLPELDVFGIVIYQADVEAKGDVTILSNGIQGAPLLNCRDDAPGPHCGIEGATAIVPFPTWEATIGARYAKRRAPARAVLDPMRDELWDVELEATLTGTSHVQDFTANLYEGEAGPNPPKLATNSTPNTFAYPLSATTTVPKRWKDTFSVRLGGDYNILPQLLSLRAGLSYASSAVRPEYMNIDVWPVQKIGVHLGATLAFGKAKLSVGYAHVFFESVQVSAGTGRVNEIVALRPEAAQAVNEGDYEASLDVLSLQGNYTF